MNKISSIHQKTRQAYNLAADTYHNLFHDELNRKSYDKKLLDFFSDQFKPGATICDAGCGPTGHIGKYILNKGMNITGVDISDRCVELASGHVPGIRFIRGDFVQIDLPDQCFDGIISFYSIIHTPKMHINDIFAEFNRMLKPGGYLLVVVKKGTEEGFLNEFIGIEAEIYFTLFSEAEIAEYYLNNGFELVFFETRNPYDYEIQNERIFAIGKKHIK